MTPFKTPYSRSTTASRRAEARSQTRFFHVSLVYNKEGEKETSCKRLTAAERKEKTLRTKHGRIGELLAYYEELGDLEITRPKAVPSGRH